MKIAILGTKGIPNNYGGFEQFAEELSTRLVRNGHSVTVYNPSFHPYSENNYKGVRIKRVFDPEKIIGSIANFIYDHLCLKDALNTNYDIIYEAGYHSVALSFWLLNIRKLNRPIVLTNMDGLEWKRSKWNPLVRKFIKFLETVAVRECRYLISDNEGIQQYYEEQFQKESFFIPYGATLVNQFDERPLAEYGLSSNNYNLLIARLEPENNIETILAAYSLASSTKPLIIVGNVNTRYGKYLRSKYADTTFKFLGGIYNKSHLDSLRHFSCAYFHGHSVGGTNPSLIEAMACNCFILAHSNPFNRSVLGADALYFSEINDLKKIISNLETLRDTNYSNFVNCNSKKVSLNYSWEGIVKQHEELFASLLKA